ncbi:MAG TPA: hypothetical protein VFN67_18305 [Polyangiales bacterium]|jgi:hypothetical protein|nr:hypothetical protein [Polyangiales bacterium]
MAKAHGMRRKLGWLMACLFIAGTSAACDDDKEADEHGDHDHGGAGSGGHDHEKMIGTPTEAACPTDNKPTYANFGEKFMKDYCLRCHSTAVKDAARNGAPSDHNFDALADIDLLKNHIDQYAGSGPKITNTKMPPSDPKPTMEEREKLSQWIACGVPK